VTIQSTPQPHFDLSEPLPAQRFYRASQTNAPSATPVLDMRLATEILLRMSWPESRSPQRRLAPYSWFVQSCPGYQPNVAYSIKEPSGQVLNWKALPSSPGTQVGAGIALVALAWHCGLYCLNSNESGFPTDSRSCQASGASERRA